MKERLCDKFGKTLCVDYVYFTSIQRLNTFCTSKVVYVAMTTQDETLKLVLPLIRKKKD